MPRFARLHAPGATVHVISRFVNREYRLDDAGRARYFARLESTLPRTDWRLLSFALMSSHTHLVMRAGLGWAADWLKPLHVGVASDLNRYQGRFGPVFAERPTIIVVPAGRTGVVVSYGHNNPVRAGLCATAADSWWTSHRYWIGDAPAPAWLHVREGLELAGFDDGPSGRAAFDAFTRAHADDPRDRSLSTEANNRARADARRVVGLPVEVTGAIDTADGGVRSVLHLGAVDVMPRWNGSLDGLVKLACDECEVSVTALHSRCRSPAVVRARRIFAAAAVLHLRRSPSEVASVLGLSRPSVSHLVRTSQVVADASLALASTVRGVGSRRETIAF